MKKPKQEAQPSRPADRTKVDPQVETRLARLVEFWESGRRSLEEHGPVLPESYIRAELGGPGPAETLRKARVFAGAERGYSRQELDQLLDQCRKANFAIGAGAMYHLPTIPKGPQRKRIQAQMLAERWTNARLETEIRRRYGNRKPKAGKDTRAPQDRAEALDRLYVLGRKWLGVSRAINQIGLELPEIARELKAATRSMEKLLEKTQPPSAPSHPPSEQSG